MVVEGLVALVVGLVGGWYIRKFYQSDVNKVVDDLKAKIKELENKPSTPTAPPVSTDETSSRG